MTIETARKRFRTLTDACDEVARLEQQIVGLNAALAKATAPAKAQNSPPQSAPAVNQPPPKANTAPAERPLADMSKRELSEALDTAHANGDKAAVAKIWAEYSGR